MPELSGLRISVVAGSWVFACACTLVCSGATAADKVDVTGTWNVEIDIGGNSGTPTFTFKQDGEKLTGKYKGQFGEADVTGTVKGNKVAFAFEVDGNKISYTGTVDKDAMQGDANYAGQASGTWTGKRAAKIDLTGTWNVKVELDGNQGTPVFTLKQNGEKLTGKYKGQFGEADVTGKIKGNEFEFTFEVEGQGKATYTGTADSDGIKGKANYADQFTGTFTGKKKTDK